MTHHWRRDPSSSPTRERKVRHHASGFAPPRSRRRGSRNGGSASFSPSASIGSSVAKPGPSVAISKGCRSVAEVQAAEIEAVDLAAGMDTELLQPGRPCMILRLVRRAEGDVMHAARALPRRRQVPLLQHVQLGGGAALAHGIDVDAVLAVRRGIVAHAGHVHHPGQHALGAREIRHVQHDRAEPANLVLRRHRAFLPRMRLAAPPSSQHQPLAFRVSNGRVRRPSTSVTLPA